MGGEQEPGRASRRTNRVQRFFGGLTIEETQAVMDVSAAAVKNDWETANLWFFRQLGERRLGDESRAI